MAWYRGQVEAVGEKPVSLGLSSHWYVQLNNEMNVEWRMVEVGGSQVSGQAWQRSYGKVVSV